MGRNWICYSVVLLAISNQQAISQTPEEKLNVGEEAIRNALSGDVQKVSDPVLESVLSELRKKGSLLNGSVVEELSKGSQSDAQARGQTSNVPFLAPSNAPPKNGSKKIRPHSKGRILSRTAEQLLKSARQLEKVGQAGEDGALSSRLRELAAELLRAD
jgi:hypothetical protein